MANTSEETTQARPKIAPAGTTSVSVDELLRIIGTQHVQIMHLTRELEALKAT